MKQRSILTAIAMFILALAFNATAFAQGKGAQTEKYTFENPFYYNGCCDETVTITGTVHITTKVTNNADGSITVSQKMNGSGINATGANGTSYVGNETGSVSQTFTPSQPFPFEFEQTFYSRLIGKGKDGHQCTIRVKVTVHFAIDADGNVTADDFDVSFDCANGTQLG